MNIFEFLGGEDDRRTAMGEMMGRQRTLVMELRDAVMPMLQAQDGHKKLLVHQMLEDILSCSSKTISLMELGVSNGNHTRLAGDKRKDRIKHTVENKRRKNTHHTGSLVTQTPHCDGYQWRKYGQKWISKAKYSRSYYRCANSKGQGCTATKTVQQMENCTTKLFNVDYYGHHVCRSEGTFCPYVVEPAHHNVATITHNQYCDSPVLVSEVHDQLQDQIMENFFTVSDMPEYSADIDMGGVAEVTMNLPLDSEDWEMGGSIGCEQESPMYIWE